MTCYRFTAKPESIIQAYGAFEVSAGADKCAYYVAVDKPVRRRK